MSILYLDCFSGAAGNMLLGALLDLGVSESVVLDALAALPLDDVELRTEHVMRGAFRATWLEFHGPERSSEERRFKQIAELLDELIEPQGVGVVVEALHLCVAMRGAKKPNTRMRTTSLLVTFETDARTRDEFLQSIDD